MTVYIDHGMKRGFNNFMDPLGAGFGGKRGFNNFMDPLGSGFGGKRGFNNFMDPLGSGFGGKRGFNNVMDPLGSGFGGKRDENEQIVKRKWFKAGAWPGFAGKRSDEGEETNNDELLEFDSKRGFNNVMDPLGSGFGGKRDEEQIVKRMWKMGACKSSFDHRGDDWTMSACSPGFYKRSNANEETDNAELLNLGSKRSFNNVMDPLGSGFGGKRNEEEIVKRMWKMGACKSSFDHRGDDWTMSACSPGFYKRSNANEETDNAEVLNLGSKRGFNNVMDPLGSGFGGKRNEEEIVKRMWQMGACKSSFDYKGGDWTMSACSPGFYKRSNTNEETNNAELLDLGSKRGFNNVMDPLGSGFGGKRGFNNVMDPLGSGFGGKRNEEEMVKRMWKMGACKSSFDHKGDDWTMNACSPGFYKRSNTNEETNNAELLDFGSKRGFNNVMDPLGSGFGGKRGFNNVMDPLGSGFGGEKE